MSGAEQDRRRNVNVRLGAAAALVLTIAAAAPGCLGSRATQGRSGTDAKLSVIPSARKVTVNETVTFEAREKHTRGQSTKVSWHTSGGKLTTTQDGRTAHAVFDTPGVYTVTGTLSVDGKVIEREGRTIEVQPP